MPQPESDVIRALREYRAAMDSMDTALMEAMARRWLEIERRLDADIAALAYEFERRAKFGENITQQMIWKAERYHILQGRMREEIGKYNRDYALDAIRAAQEQFATLGISASNAAILASYPGAGALSASWNRINVNAVQAMIGFAGDGSPLSKLLRNDYGDASQGLMDALINGLARGLNPAAIAAEMRDGFGMGLDRALLIARTEAARAYRSGSIEQYRQSGVVSGYMRLVKKATACPACLFQDGQKFKLAEEMTDHPRGKCQTIPITLGVLPPTWQTGREWFMLQTPEQQQKILGPGKWKLWQDLGFPLSRFAGHTHSDVWGDSPSVPTMEELKG